MRLAKLASAIGAAIVTTVYFTQVAQGGVHAVAVVGAVVGAVVAVCLGVVWLLPKNAPAEDHYMDRRATSPLVMQLAVLVFSLRADPDPRYAAR